VIKPSANYSGWHRKYRNITHQARLSAKRYISSTTDENCGDYTQHDA
jgi:hypothetical protein